MAEPGGTRPPAPSAGGRLSADVLAENEAWVAGLGSTAASDHEATVARLYALLTKMAFAEVRRKGTSLSLAGPEMDDVARQAAADATLTICRKVDTFRGDCRFTTVSYTHLTLPTSDLV